MSELALKLIAQAKETRATRLDLGNCGLTELPDELFELTWLEDLNLSAEWSEYSFEEKEWVGYDSQNHGTPNFIKRINPQIRKLRELKKLILSGQTYGNEKWDLSKISPLKDLIALQYLDISATQVSDLSPLKNLTTLQFLNIDSTQVTDLYPLKNLIALQHLSVGSTQVTDLNPLKNLIALQQLHISSTQVTDLYPLKDLIALQHLSIDSTQVTDLSPLKDLIALQHLNAGSTQVSNLSPLKDLIALQHLNASSTQVSNLSPLKGLTTLQFLDVSRTPIRDLSPLKNFTALRFLIIGSTQVTDLSPLGNLMALEAFVVSSTQVSDLSPLKNLSALRLLFVSSTQVTDLNPLKNLPALLYLNSDKTRVHDLSPLKDLITLQSLDVSSSQVSDLNPLKELKALQELNLSSTQVSDLSPLKNLLNITLLDLRGSKVRSIDSLKQIIALNIPVLWNRKYEQNEKGIFLEGTRLDRNMKAAVLSGEDANQAVLDYMGRKKQKIYEARVLIMGEPRAGKSTLKLKLRNPNAEMPTEEESTKGIDIDIKTYNCPIHSYDFIGKPPKLSYNVWDFGGQEMYKILHQLFVAEDSAYIIVTNTDRNKNEDEIEFWLETIEKLGKSKEEGRYGPVILFQNAKTDRPEFNSFRNLRERFTFWEQKEDFIINLNRISKKTAEDKKRFDAQELVKFKKFQKYLETQLQTLPQVGEEIPVEWAKIRRKLVALQHHDYIRVDEFRTICTKNEITDPAEQMRLSKMLHVLGIVLHYQESDAELLRGMVILNRKWATDALYRVLDSKIVTDNNGWFLKSDAKDIWFEVKYQDKIGELLALMEEFKMCYLNQRLKRYVVPSKLPFDPPQTPIWETTDNVRLNLQYDWLPRPIVTQLIVSLHEYIANNQNWIWRRGAVISGDKLDAKGALARIVDNIKENKIEISAKGDLSEDLIKSILNKWREINETYAGKVEVTRIILCNCERCKKERKPFEFDYTDVLAAKAANKQLRCNKSFEDMSPAKILRGIFDDRTFHQDLRRNYPQQFEHEFDQKLRRIDIKSDIILDKLEDLEYDVSEILSLNRKQIVLTQKLELQINSLGLVDEQFKQIHDILKAGFDKVIINLPTENNFVEAWKKANEKMEGVGEYKLKLKLDIPFLPFAVEKEVEWDLKNVFGDTWDRLKAIVKDGKPIKTLFVEE